VKKNILFIFVVLIVYILTSCTNVDYKDPTALEPDKDILGDFEIEIPLYDDLKSYNLYYLDDSNILICYQSFDKTSKSLWSVFNIRNKEFEIIYTGKFNISDGLERKKTKKSYIFENALGKIIIDKNDFSISEVIYEKPTGYSLLSPDGEYTIIRDFLNLKLENNKTNDIKDIEIVGRTISSLVWSPDSEQIVYLADNFTIVVVDPATTEYYTLEPGRDFPLPEGLVAYMDIYHIDNNKILLDGACETNSVYQLIDKNDGELLWSYSGKNECQIFDIKDNFIIFAEGPKKDRDILLYDMSNNSSKIIYNATDEYVVNSKLSDNGSWLAVLFMSEEKQYIKIISIKFE
jgi:hypothetical protein